MDSTDSALKRKHVSSFCLSSHIHGQTPHLLLALPALLSLPPTHREHIISLRLCLLAARRCVHLRDHLSLNLTPELECRAWTTFVEVAMKIIGAGLSSEGPESQSWAKGLEAEVGTAITKALALAQKHPSLRLFKHHLTLYHAQLAHWQNNYKFARALLRRHVASLSSIDPRAHYYATHLALASFALASSPVDTPSALHSLNAILSLAEQWNDPDIAILSKVIKLHALVSALQWNEVFPLLTALEAELGFIFSDNSKSDNMISNEKIEPFLLGRSHVIPLAIRSLNTPAYIRKPTVSVAPRSIPLKASLELHTLILGVLAYVHSGQGAEATKRVTKLHTVLDSGVLAQDGVRDGVVEIPVQDAGLKNVSLHIQVTHPRVLFHLAFLVSAVAMRDAAGRKPKSKVFASTGLEVCAKERPKPGQNSVGRFPSWSGLRVRQDVETHLVEIEADLLCELISVCIQRSEFGEAEEYINKVIAHTRTHGLWDAYSARVTLYHCHLAHALCQVDRALECYRIAVHLAQKTLNSNINTGFGHARLALAKFIRVAAEASEIGLRLGLARQKGIPISEELRRRGKEISKECRYLSGTLEAVGRVLDACLTDEIVLAKNHLKGSLGITTNALDNHLRALVLALISSHYLHTSPEYAEMMLMTSRQLAAGLGAPASKPRKEKIPPKKVGNAILGLWVGERFSQLYRRTGRDKRAKQQRALNLEFKRALNVIEWKGKTT